MNMNMNMNTNMHMHMQMSAYDSWSPIRKKYPIIAKDYVSNRLILVLLRDNLIDSRAKGAKQSGELIIDSKELYDIISDTSEHNHNHNHKHNHNNNNNNNTYEVPEITKITAEVLVRMIPSILDYNLLPSILTIYNVVEDYYEYCVYRVNNKVKLYVKNTESTFVEALYL